MGAEGFSCSLDVLYGGLEISILQFFLSKKDIKKFSTVFFFFSFGHQNPGFGLDTDPDSLEMLDPDLDSMSPDPQL